MCLINLSSGKIYSPSSVVENRSAENKKTWFRKLLGNKNIFKNTFYDYQNILYWFFIPVKYKLISNMIMKKQYYWIFVLFWEKGIVYTLAELVYFMLSNDRMHAEGADWVRRYCTGISRDTYMGMLIYMYHRLPGEHSIHQTEINSRKIATLFKIFYISRD